MGPQCPVCRTKIDEKDYELDSTRKILSQVKTIQEFARFIGLFYIKSYLMLLLALIFIAAAFVVLLYGGAGLFDEYMGWNRITYIALAFIAILCFNWYLEMRKVEVYYKDFQVNNNTYFIFWPFKSEFKTIMNDASTKIPNNNIMKKRHNAYEKKAKDGERILRFNSVRLFHPQKPKLFHTKKFFYDKFIEPGTKHILITGDYKDESFVLVEGAIHGFLIMDNSIITIYNTPGITKKVLNEIDLLDVKKEDPRFKKTDQRYQK
jgi:hypothetical protein